MFQKNLVLELNTKMLSANQIAEFLKLEETRKFLIVMSGNIFHEMKLLTEILEILLRTS